MRWTDLFRDLDAQMAALEAQDLAAEVAELTRAEVGRLLLADRLRAARGAVLRLRVLGGDVVVGELADVGADWVVVEEAARAQVLVLLPAVVGVDGLGRSAQPGGEVDSRLRATTALRALARDRARVRLHLVDGTALEGTIDRVAADHLDVAAHPVDEVRRAGAASATTVALAALAVVRPS